MNIHASPTPRKTVGCIGIGSIGWPMARRLFETGHDVMVLDLDATAVRRATELGARPATSVREVADCCGTVVVCLPTVAAAESVLLDPALISGDAVSLVISTGTIGPTLTQRSAAAASSQGVAFVDSPVSGGRDGATAGTLSVMASGRPADITRAESILASWGHVTVVGSTPGAGQTTKLVNNSLVAISLFATAQVLGLCRASGVDEPAAFEAVNRGFGRNGATLTFFPEFVWRGVTFGSPLDMLMKDLDLAIAEADALGIDVSACHTARAAGQKLQDAGWGQADLVDALTASIA